LARLSQIKTDIEVILFFSIGLFKIRHDFLSSLLYLSSCSNDGNLFVFLLNVVEWMVDFLERRLTADSELGDSRSSFE
jgi:hypothetical protein